MRLVILPASFLVVAAFAQQTADSKGKSDQAKQPPADANQPLFQKKSTYKSSGKSKESATLAFNGIDPSGKVNSAVLNSSAGGDDDQKVKQMASRVPKPKQVASFQKEGGLLSR